MDNKIITLVEQDRLRNDLVFNENDISHKDKDFGLNDTHMYCFSTIKNTHIVDRSGYISPVRLKDSLAKIDLGVPTKKYINKRGVFIISYRVLRGLTTENIGLYCDIYDTMVNNSPTDELLIYLRDRLKTLRDKINDSNGDTRRDALSRLRDGIEGRRITFIPDSCFLENEYVYVRSYDIYIVRAADRMLSGDKVINMLKDTSVKKSNHIEITVVDNISDNIYYTNIGGVVVNIQPEFDPTKESYVDIIHHSGGIERYRRNYTLEEALTLGFIGITPADVKKTLSHDSIMTEASNKLELAKIEIKRMDIEQQKENNKRESKLLKLKQLTDNLKHLNEIETMNIKLDISKYDAYSKIVSSQMKIEELKQKKQNDLDSHLLDMAIKSAKKIVS